jgi:hypothetical protein
LPKGRALSAVGMSQENGQAASRAGHVTDVPLRSESLR